MVDPRIAEIEFLTTLARKHVQSVCATLHPESSGVGDVSSSMHSQRYGLTPTEFLDLLIAMIRANYITEPGIAPAPNVGVSLSSFSAVANRLVEKLFRAQASHIVVTHEGRVRSWALRDELLKNPELDPMGILLGKRAWERDLDVRLIECTSEVPLTVIFFDVDDFGTVNKSKGHDISDRVLKALFGRIRDEIGVRGAVYRFGGDEVGALLRATPQEDGRTIAEQVRAAVQRDVIVSVPEFGREQTVSVGVATFNERMSARSALETVDALARKAKIQGKNRVVWE